jgi:hypothetical protein
MISAFNALLECFVTGLVTALIIYGMARIGMFSLVIITSTSFDEDDDEL